MIEILQKSNRYQKEIQGIKERVEKIQIESLRQELNLMIKKLIAEVENMDKHHLGLLENSRLPNVVDGTRENIMLIRKKLFKKLEDYESSIKE